MERRGSALGYERTLMYGRYREDLGQFALTEARKNSLATAGTVKQSSSGSEDEKQSVAGTTTTKSRKKGSTWKIKRTLADCLSYAWNQTFARVGEDWIFLALLGTIMAILSYLMDRVIYYCSKTRMYLVEMSGGDLSLKYLAWTSSSVLLILFAAGFVHLTAPQAIGSGIPEIKTILRGVILKEYLTFKTLLAKMVGLTFTLGSGMPLGKEGPFVHIASIVATLLSKLVTGFKGIYENESRSGEMLAAAAAIGVASTFYSPIGGVLFSIEVTSQFFAVRNYWRGFFAACCGATVWRLLGVWIHAKDMTITALFKTSFRSDFPFDIVELIVFALIGVVCGFAGAGYVAFHRMIVRFNRNQKWLNRFLQTNRFLYPGIVTFIISSCFFPDFLGKYMAATLNTHDQIDDFFSNQTWYLMNHTERIVRDWTTPDTNVFFHLSFFIFMLWWTSALASTMPVPSGLFIPVFKMGAAFGRLVGEIASIAFPNGISLSGHANPIVPGGYAVIGAAAFSGAVTHTISTCLIVFELTGQLSHIIPCIIAVLIANAIAQSLYPSIYDSIIQIKKLPFLPNISSTSSAAHSIFVEDIMVRDVVYAWMGCTYNDLRKILKTHKQIQSFPLVDSPQSMILLGSVQRQELQLALSRYLSRERRLLEIQKRSILPKTEQATMSTLSPHSATVSPSAMAIHQSSSSDPIAPASGGGGGGGGGRRMSRFEVTPVDSSQITFSLDPAISEPSSPTDPRSIPLKSILKHSTVSYPGHITTTSSYDSRIRQTFDSWFRNKGHQERQLGHGDKNNSYSAPTSPLSGRKVRMQMNDALLDMSAEELLQWEEEKLRKQVDFSSLKIDPAPFQLVEHTTLIKVHSLFSMLQLNHTYVTSTGKLIGVVALKDIRVALEKVNSGTFHASREERFSFSKSAPPVADSLASINSETSTSAQVVIETSPPLKK